MNEHAVPAVSQHAPVLIVDDDRRIRELLRLIMENAGYTVLEARDGLQALAILHSQPAPMIVLTNHQMPRLDGQGLLRKVLEEPALVSGYAYLYMTAGTKDIPTDLQQLLTALHAPALFKPIRAATLLHALADAASRLRIAETAPDGAIPGDGTQVTG